MPALHNSEIMHQTTQPRFIVLVSADSAWRVIREFHDQEFLPTPFGEAFITEKFKGECDSPVCYMQAGWGKIAAAAATQYAIDTWRPDLLINIGTCGGFRGQVQRGEIILVQRTIVYDLHVEIGDPQEEIAHYTTVFEQKWPENLLPPGLRAGTILTGDRDIIAADVPHLVASHGALGADWESGAVAYVANRNNVRCIILRGVSDLVGPDGGEAYGAGNTLYEESTVTILQELERQLPQWLWIAAVHAGW